LIFIDVSCIVQTVDTARISNADFLRSAIVTCLTISSDFAGLFLKKMKPQHPQRTTNPKMAEKPMAAA
jgi:hypothetical protein